ncbi:MAG: FAD-binding oxidoreductase [Nitratireductor sp.]
MAEITVSRLPMDPGPAAWNDILPKANPYPALEGNQAFDVVIIGAGFAGLSTARRLLQIDPKLAIAIVDARRVGEGPAGRNSGFMIDLPHNLVSSDYAGDQGHDLQQTTMNRHAISFARQAASEYGMEAEALQPVGKINAAAGTRGVRHNQTYAGHLARLGEPFELLDARQMQEICGSPYYRNGLFTPGTVMLQPALYVRRLAEGLVRDGITILENSPVNGMRRQGNDWTASTLSGSITAGKVVLATNGHVESFGFFERRLMHVYLYASMSAPLSAEQIRTLGGTDNWAFTPSDPFGSTIRKITGGSGTRIVVRNGISWAPDRTISPTILDHMKKQHDRSFRMRFGAIADVPMQFRWGGLLCMSRNAVPAFGEIDNNLYSACCQNGLGTAMGTLSGMATAEKLMGSDSALVRFFEGLEPPALLPREPFLGIGARAHLRFGEFRAGREI